MVSRSGLLRGGALALLLGLVALPVEATNTTDDDPLVVTTFDGKVHTGVPSLGKDKLDLKGQRRTKLRYRDVASIAEPTTASAAELDQRRAELARRKAKLEEGEGTAEAWAKLARWALDQELPDEARACWERSAAKDGEYGPAQHALGKVKGEDGAWADARKLVQARVAAVTPAGDKDGLVGVARWALDQDQPDLAFELLRGVLNRDTYHAAAIELSRPFTRRYRQQTPLSLMVRGRWKASEDRSRHHQRKAWAAYALDLYKVDAEGNAARTKQPKTLEDFYGFGAPFYAVHGGRVAEVREGNPDNPLNVPLDDVAEKHNGLTIDHGNGELSWYVHAQKGSIVVKVGDVVERGQLLGRVGNSGGSAQPHMHYTLITWGNLSVPWACDDYLVIAPDGTPLPVTRACPREGWIIESREPE